MDLLFQRNGLWGIACFYSITLKNFINKNRLYSKFNQIQKFYLEVPF